MSLNLLVNVQVMKKMVYLKQLTQKKNVNLRLVPHGPVIVKGMNANVHLIHPLIKMVIMIMILDLMETNVEAVNQVNLVGVPLNGDVNVSQPLQRHL